MSEIKTETKEIKDKSETDDMLDTHVALIIAERDDLTEKLAEACDEIERLQKDLANAKAIISEDSKAALVNWLVPRTTIKKDVLSRMSYDDLLNYKKVLEHAQMPAFQAGTPYGNPKKPSQRDMLANMNKEFMAKLRGGNV